MEKYKVIIDRSSNTYEIEAASKQEAEEKAMKEFEDRDDYTDYDYWVGECNEVENE